MKTLLIGFCLALLVAIGLAHEGWGAPAIIFFTIVFGILFFAIFEDEIR